MGSQLGKAASSCVLYRLRSKRAATDVKCGICRIMGCSSSHDAQRAPQEFFKVGDRVIVTTLNSLGERKAEVQ